MSKELIKSGLELLQNPKVEVMNKNDAIEAFKSISHALNYMSEFVRGSYSIVDRGGSIYKILFDLTKKINADIKDDGVITYDTIFLNAMPKTGSDTDVAYKRFSSHYKDSQKKATQFGVDISEGLPHSKKTILFGRVDEGGTKKTFFKLEEHGTYGLKANILHGFDFMKAVDENSKDFSEKRIGNELREVIKKIVTDVVQKDGNIGKELTEEENKLIDAINGVGKFKVSALTSIFDKLTKQGKENYAKFLQENVSKKIEDLTMSRVDNKTGGEPVINQDKITKALNGIETDKDIEDGVDGTINGNYDELYISKYISNNTDTENAQLTQDQLFLYKSYCDYNTNNDDEIEPISEGDDDAKSVTSETVDCMGESKAEVKHEYEYIYNKVNATKVVEVQEVQKNTYEYVNSNLNNLNKPSITNYSIGDKSNENFFDYNDGSEGWKLYMDGNKNNNPTFVAVLDNLINLSKGKVKINGLKLEGEGLKLVKGSENDLDVYNEKLWAGGRFLLRFDTPDGADKFLTSIDTSALYRREAATHGSEYNKDNELVEKKESGISALFKGLFFGTHYGVNLNNSDTSEGQRPGHLYINKENHTLIYYASKIPLIGSKFQKEHYSEMQIGIENHAAPGVIGLLLDKIGIKKAAHSTSGESDGINPIGAAKNIYKVKLNPEGEIKNKEGLKAYLNKVDIKEDIKEDIRTLEGEWTTMDGNPEYKYCKANYLYFSKDSKDNVLVANPKTIKDGGAAIFDINGKTIDVDKDKVNELKALQEDSFTLKDTRDVLHGLIVMPQAYSVTKSIAKEVINPFPKVFGLGNISDYIPKVDKDKCEVFDVSIVDLGSRALEVFNDAFNSMIEKPVEYIENIDNTLENNPSWIASVPYNFLIKSLAPDNLNATFNALDFYLNGWSIFVIPAMKTTFEYFEYLTENSMPTDESSAAYTYVYNSLYAGYSFSKHYLFYANNTGLYKTELSSEKFMNAIGGAIGDVNKKSAIEEEVKYQDVGIATYVADTGVIYGLSGNSTIATDKKWLPVKLASSLISYSFKAFNFYNAHNAIKYVDNKYVGASDGLNNAVTGAVNLGKGAYKSMPEVSEYVYGSISKLTDYMLSIVAKENNELSEVLEAFNELIQDKESIFEGYKDEIFSFNAKNKEAFKEHKNILAKKYLEEIVEYVEDFQADLATGFCDLKKEMVIYYTILHYTRKAGTLKYDDVMLSSSNKKDHPGYEFYQKHYERQEIVQDFKSICALRKSIDEFAKENSIQEGEYKEFCKANQENMLCSDFVKDVMFPELVDA